MIVLDSWGLNVWEPPVLLLTSVFVGAGAVHLVLFRLRLFVERVLLRGIEGDLAGVGRIEGVAGVNRIRCALRVLPVCRLRLGHGRHSRNGRHLVCR